MATIKKRGQNYIFSVNMGYDYNGNKINPVQKTITSPENLEDSERENWLNEQAFLFEQEVKRRQAQAITVLEFAELWLADLSKIYHERNSTDLKWILPRLGNYDLKRLTPKTLSDFHSDTKAETTLSFTSREHIHRTLCTMLTFAVERGYLKLNPAFHTFQYEKKSKKTAELSAELLRKFIKGLDDEMPKYQLFYKLLLATGVKRAECAGLKWSDVDFESDTIRVERIVIAIPHEPVFTKAVSPRTVHLSENMCALLHSVQRNKVDGYIFAQPNGLPMLPSSFTYRLKLICKKHGLPSDFNMETVYSTHARLLKTQCGADIKAYLNLQRELGL